MKNRSDMSERFFAVKRKNNKKFIFLLHLSQKRCILTSVSIACATDRSKVMITAQEAAERWGVSLRRVQDYCKKGKIPGAGRFGLNWMIPEDAKRPIDGRRKSQDATKKNEPQKLIRKSPFLNMTDLYNEPGSAQRVIDSLKDYPESKALFTAEMHYCRGEIDKVLEYANMFLDSHSGFYAIISGGMQLAMVSMWRGDTELFIKAKQHLYEAPWKTELDRDVISLSVAVCNLLIRNTSEFPEWFSRGRFENLPADAQPAAWVYYIKYLIIQAQDIAAERSSKNEVSGLGLMRTYTQIIEPMISLAVVNKTIIAEIYLRLLCAVAYHQAGDDENAAFHLDRAIVLCIPDGLYGILCEWRRQLGLFLDERLMLADPQAVKKVRELHKSMQEGWTKLHNAVLKNSVSAKLSDREREVARLVAFGLSDQQIAEQLHLTKASVKSMIQMVRNKTGVRDRSNFGAYI